MDVVVFPRGEGKGKDWQWEFHVIPFGMEGMLPGKSSPAQTGRRLQREEGIRKIASKHSEGRRKQSEQTGLQQKIIIEKRVKGERGGFMFYFSRAKL